MGLLTRRQRFKNDLSMPSTHGISYSSLIGGIPITYVNATNALKNSDIFSVIQRISADIASASFKTENSYASQVLNHPNNLIGRFSFWQAVIIQLLCSGNAYVPILGMTLEQRPPSEVQINLDSGNQLLQYKLNAFNDDPETTLDQSKMLHFRIMPDANYRYLIGMSPLESLTDEMTIAYNSKKASLNSVKNQINPIGLLNVKNAMLSNEDKDNAREQFEAANSGDNVGRLMILDNNTEFSQLQVKSDVFQALNENSKYSANQISKAFGVPVDMLGGGADTESQHSNIDQIKSSYIVSLNGYINPIIDELKLKFNAPDLKLDVKSSLDVDDSLIINQVNSMVSAGTLSPQQAQQILLQNNAVPSNLIPYEQEGGDVNA